MVLTMMLKTSFCANMCHRKKLLGSCCENNGYGPICALEDTTAGSAVCISNAASWAGTVCTMSASTTQDCTNVLVAKDEATLATSGYRSFEIEYMSNKNTLSETYLDFYDNAYSSVCKPMYCEPTLMPGNSYDDVDSGLNYRNGENNNKHG